MNEIQEQDEREGLSSASSWERVHYCAGSVPLIASIPKEQRQSTSSGEAADSGTRIHKAWETDSDDGLKLSEQEIKERLKTYEQGMFNAWRYDVLRPVYGDVEPDKITVVREQREWIFDDNLNKIASAKVDVAYVYQKHALIIDGKTGYNPTTPAQRNLQAKVQAVSISSAHNIQHARVAIAQYRFSGLVTQADYHEEDLIRAYAEILFDDWRSKQPDAQRVPGPWCEYCPAMKAGACPEQATWSLLPSHRMVGSPARELISAYVDSLTPIDLAFIERRRKLGMALFEAVKDRLKGFPAEELKALGFELGPGRPQSAVTDFNGLVDHLYNLKDAGELLENEFPSVFSFTIGKLEEAIIPRRIAAAKAQDRKLTEKDAKAQLRNELSKFINFDATRTDKILKEIKA